MTLLATATLLAALALAGGPETEPVAAGVPAGDLGRLQGTWTALAGPNRDIPVELTIAGADVRVRLEIRAAGLEVNARGTIRIDESVSPRALDWVGFRGADGMALPELSGIYALESSAAGETLRVCNGGPGDRRPGAFVAGGSALADVVTFQRRR